MDKLTCDFCGVTSANVTLIANPPEKFEHFQFCETSNCYQKYSDYIEKSDISQGVPFAVMKGNIHCDWCGSKSGVVKFNDSRDPNSKFKKYRNMHSNFCLEGPCTVNYSKFIYARDLSKGLPYSVRCTLLIHDCGRDNYQCGYCRKKSPRVIYNPWTEENLKCKIFCSNKTCYDRFYNYCTVKVPKIPYAIEHNL